MSTAGVWTRSMKVQPTWRSSTDLAEIQRSARPRKGLPDSGQWDTEESIPMRKTIAKAVTWRLIGTAEIFAISFWTTGHIATAGHTAGIAAITSILMYVAHELAWGEHEAGGQGSPTTRPNRGRPCDVLKLLRYRLNRSTVVTASSGRAVERDFAQMRDHA
jgi:uncharacterized membrane protein